MLLLVYLCDALHCLIFFFANIFFCFLVNFTLHSDKATLLIIGGGYCDWYLWLTWIALLLPSSFSISFPFICWMLATHYNHKHF